MAVGRRAMVRLLLRHKASVDLHEAGGMTALMLAASASAGSQECVQELLEAGASTKLRDQCGGTALGLAEGMGHSAIAELLRQHAAAPPATTAAPTLTMTEEIVLAAYHGELQQVIEWLQQGRHVDAPDKDGDGLLHAAASGGRLRVAKELLKRGASIDLRAAHGITALMSAAMEGQHAMVRLLLEHKASIDLQSAAGGTALMAAAIEGHTECVQELLEAGASTELRDQFGRTALQIAESEDHAAVAESLRQHAATQPATAAAPTPNLSGRRVRIGGLKARPELNGRCGVAGRFDAAKGRYAVAVEGEAQAVLLKPANLQDVGKASAATEPAALPLDVLLATSNGDLQQAAKWLQKGGDVDVLGQEGVGMLRCCTWLRKVGTCVWRRSCCSAVPMSTCAAPRTSPLSWWLRERALTPWCACCSSTRRASTYIPLIG